MAFEKATVDKIIEHIKSTWTVQSCPMCKQNNWEIHGQVTLALGSGARTSAAGQSLPCALIVCQVCGNSLIINLVVAGAL